MRLPVRFTPVSGWLLPGNLGGIVDRLLLAEGGLSSAGSTLRPFGNMKLRRLWDDPLRELGWTAIPVIAPLSPPREGNRRGCRRARPGFVWVVASPAPRTLRRRAASGQSIGPSGHLPRRAYVDGEMKTAIPSFVPRAHGVGSEHGNGELVRSGIAVVRNVLDGAAAGIDLSVLGCLLHFPSVWLELSSEFEREAAGHPVVDQSHLPLRDAALGKGLMLDIALRRLRRCGAKAHGGHRNA